MDFHLLDYRRQVFEMYRVIRQIGLDQLVAFVLFKETRDNLFRNHSQSLLPAKERERFIKLSYYDYNSNYKAKAARYTEFTPENVRTIRVQANGLSLSDYQLQQQATQQRSEKEPVLPQPSPTVSSGGSSGSLSIGSEADQPHVPFYQLTHVGRVNFRLFNQDWALGVYRTPEGGVFIPFRDATNGVTTYPGGRYLYHTQEGADLGSTINRESGSVLLALDFNYAFNPPRCYNDVLSSLVPVENSLSVKIEAGEKLAWERNAL